MRTRDDMLPARLSIVCLSAHIERRDTSADGFSNLRESLFNFRRDLTKVSNVES